MFGIGNKKTKTDLRPLTEEDIKNRLYGGAVGISAERPDKEYSKKPPPEEKRASLQKKELDEERGKIQRELNTLKKELAQTRRRLQRMRGIRTKKIRLLIIAAIIVILASVFALMLVRNILPNAKKSKPLPAESAQARYTIQVAVYSDEADANRFLSSLSSKGYKPFIKESRYTSGRPKFTVYAGTFQDREGAEATLNLLRTRENKKDSYITPLPK